MSVVIETTIGDITVDLYLDDRPRTCLNFLKLCKMKYYNFCLFHKIQRNFIAQSGDPSGTGRGGESIFQHLYGEQAKYFDSEFKPRIKHKKLGMLSMINNGNNMNGSQFFITLGEDLTYLDEEHSVFGEVAEGFEVLVKLNDTICDTSNRPYQDIRITHTVILHDPYEDPSNLEIPPSSPIPTDEILASDYVRADEDIDDNKGKTMEEIEEDIKDKEAKARATILEMVGDIPDADVKPPENVLFVCKLNPVTTDEDLEIIFSRFGTIVSCEVIKDKKTGESLQYAFIEFDREEDCETAYFKMDNVLIDDRRIHVDFSQSVAKLKFDEHNRPIIDNKYQRKEKIIVKDISRKSGNYEMIFDSDDGNDHENIKKQKKKKHRKHSTSPEISSKSSKEKSRNSRQKYRSSPPSHNLSKSQSSSYHSRSLSYSPSPERPKTAYYSSKKYTTSEEVNYSSSTKKHSLSSEKSKSYYSSKKYSSKPEYTHNSSKHSRHRSRSSSPYSSKKYNAKYSGHISEKSSSSSHKSKFSYSQKESSANENSYKHRKHRSKSPEYSSSKSNRHNKSVKHKHKNYTSSSDSSDERYSSKRKK